MSIEGVKVTAQQIVDFAIGFKPFANVQKTISSSRGEEVYARKWDEHMAFVFGMYNIFNHCVVTNESQIVEEVKRMIRKHHA